MEKSYPRYPVDFCRLRIPFMEIGRSTEVPRTAIVDIVRENPFGTAFTQPRESEQTSENFS